MENSTKIIIGSSIAIVGVAAVYFVMSRKKETPAGGSIINMSSPGELPPTDAIQGTTLSTTNPLQGITEIKSEPVPAVTPTVKQKTSVGMSPSQIRPTDANINTGAPSFGISVPTQDGTVPPPGKLLRNYCDGIKLMGEYTDGLGGKVVKVIDAKSQPCGYVPPSTDFSDSNDYPEVTAMLINELYRVPGLQATLKKWREEELKFRNPNFDSTAPFHGNKSLYQYAIQEMFRHGYSNRRCSVNRDMNDFLIDKRGSGGNGTDFNDWGRSVVNNKDHFNCDYKTENLTLAFINARDIEKANSAGVYARKLASDLIKAYNQIFTI